MEYIRHIGSDNYFIRHTCSRWSNFVKHFIEHRQGQSDDPYKIVALNSFILSLFHFGTDDIIMQMNIGDCMTEYIQNGSDFLKFGWHGSTFKGYNHNVEDYLLDILIKCFDLLGVKFKALDYESSNKELFQKVYEHDQYELNKGNIWLMLKTMYGLEETVDFFHRNLTVIMSNLESPLTNYVWENIETYIKVILAYCDNAISDDEQVVLDVLNCDEKELDSEIKIAYLTVLKTKIAELSAIDFNEIWKKILELDLCNNSQKNVLTYFEQHGLDDNLINFINNHEALGYDGENIDTEKLLEKFFDAIIIANNIADDRYSLILTSIDHYYDAFDIVNISKIKIDILIDNKIIRMTSDALPFIRESYPNNLMRYIEKNIADYAALMTEELFLLDEILNVFKLNVADEYKINLLGFTDEPLSVLNEGYTNAVKAHILENNFWQPLKSPFKLAQF